MKKPKSKKKFFIVVNLNQRWFASPFWGCLALSGNIFAYHNWKNVIVSGGQRSGMQLIPSNAQNHPYSKELSAPQVSVALSWKTLIYSAILNYWILQKGSFGLKLMEMHFILFRGGPLSSQITYPTCCGSTSDGFSFSEFQRCSLHGLLPFKLTVSALSHCSWLMLHLCWHWSTHTLNLCSLIPESMYSTNIYCLPRTMLCSGIQW